MYDAIKELLVERMASGGGVAGLHQHQSRVLVACAGTVFRSSARSDRKGVAWGVKR